MKIEDYALTDDNGENQEFRYNSTIPTALGDFEVEIWINDGDPLDQVCLDKAQEAVKEVVDNFDKFHDLVYQDYKTCVDEDPDFLGFSDTPLDLTKETISKHLEARLITISRDKHLEYHPELFACRFYVSPEWEVEHGFYLTLCEGEPERVDC